MPGNKRKCAIADKIETCNAFLIRQTPYPSDSESACTQMGMCLCSPFRLVEAIGMMGYGIVTFLVPCCTFDLDTHHSNNDIEMRCCHPGCTWLPSPCHYKYSIDGDGCRNFTKGCVIGCKNCGNIRPQGVGGSFYMTSHTPGGICLMGGLGKLTSVLCDILCCPVTATCWSRTEVSRGVRSK